MPLLELTRNRSEGEELRLTLEPLARLAVIGVERTEQAELALAAAGLLPEGIPHDGTRVLAGRPYPDSEAALGAWRGKRIGYLGPPTPLPTDYTVRRFVALALGPTTALQPVLTRSGIAQELADRPVAALSPFAQQSLQLSLAQWQEPELLVCLEPARGLTADDSASLMARIRSRDCAVLLFTSNADAARALDGEIAVIHHGRLIERGPAARMTTAGQHEATRRLLVPERRGDWSGKRPQPGEILLDAKGVTTAAHPDAATDLVVRQGEVVGLMGETGAGKTDLLRVLAGLDRPLAGTLRVDAVTPDFGKLPFTARLGIAHIGADPYASFNPDHQVGLTLTEPMRVEQQLVVEEQADRLVEAVLAVGLVPERLEMRPDRFTPYEMQQLALARALIGRPKLLVIDAPTELLDRQHAGDLIRLIERLRSDFGLTILVASRDFDHLSRIADRIVVLAAGGAVEEGPPEALREAPTHPVTRRLIGSAPVEAN